MEVENALEKYILENVEKAKKVDITMHENGEIKIMTDDRNNIYSIEFESGRFTVKENLLKIEEGVYDNKKLEKLLRNLETKSYKVAFERAKKIALSLQKKFFIASKIKENKNCLEILDDFDNVVLARVYFVREFKIGSYISREYLTSYEEILRYLEITEDALRNIYIDCEIDAEIILGVYELVHELIKAYEKNDIDTAVFCMAKLKAIFNKYKVSRKISYDDLLYMLISKVETIKHMLKDNKLFEEVSEIYRQFIDIILLYIIK